MPQRERLREEDIKMIRLSPWPDNPRKVSIDSKVVEETVMSLKLTNCPVCGGPLELTDNAGTPLPYNFGKTIGADDSVQKYCSNENYIIELTAHRYESNTYGTELYIYIRTNTLNSKLIAHSGLLAEINKHVELALPF